MPDAGELSLRSALFGCWRIARELCDYWWTTERQARVRSTCKGLLGPMNKGAGPLGALIPARCRLPGKDKGRRDERDGAEIRVAWHLVSSLPFTRCLIHIDTLPRS